MGNSHTEKLGETLRKASDPKTRSTFKENHPPLFNPGDIVLDPFCGSGTTGVVAVRYGRRFVGIDFVEKYLRELAIPRIEDEIKENSLFLKEVSEINYIDVFEEVFK